MFRQSIDLLPIPWFTADKLPGNNTEKTGVDRGRVAQCVFDTGGTKV